MDIRKLQHVAILAKTGNFSRAAERLNITQSALTRSIQAIEQELGLRLFDCGRGGAVPTRAGLQLVQEGEDLLQRMRTLENNMTMLASGEAGDVSFGMGPLPASVILPDLLSFAAQKHSGIRLNTQIGRLSELLTALKSDSLEFVILSQSSIDEQSNIFSNHRIGKMQLVALVREGHPLLNEASPPDLSVYPLIGGTPPDDENNRNNRIYNPSIMCDNYHVLRDVALRSDAVWITADCMAQGEFVALDGVNITQQLQIVAISMPGRHLSPSARLLIDKAAAILNQF